MGHKNLVTTDPQTSYPPFLKQAYKADASSKKLRPPVLIKPKDKADRAEFEQFLKAEGDIRIVDNYAEQYAELLLSQHPHLYNANYEVQVASIQDLLAEHYGQKEPWELGTWAYYPWSRTLVHVLEQTAFEDLRSIRNRDLITAKEQQKLADFEVACFGMSVGSASALALAISGISRRIKLIDGAVISGSNLNRILTGVESVGVGKATVIGQKIYEMNPYATVETFDKVTAGNIGHILDAPWPVKAAIDEIDDIEMKALIRMEARQRRIPVIMASELGDTVVLDVERFDLEPKRPIFHDMVPGIEDIINKPIENKREWMKYAVKILDPKNMPIKLQKSLLKIGSTIVTHPQLGSTVMMTGGMLAFAVKSIALHENLASGRYVISLEQQLLADHKTRAHKRQHRKHTKVIQSAIDSM